MLRTQVWAVYLFVQQVDVPTSELYNLAEDYLELPKLFFPPISRSARHIYHSALPLSPRSSTLRSAILQEKTLITDFYGCPDTSAAITRTFKCMPDHFACLTTFGHSIAVACDKGTVGIYDSTTSALRLSLSSADPVQVVRGSPDGSILLCAHKSPSITLWDLQTGGLIHTFVLELKVEDIAISSKGLYIAGGLSDGSVKIWEVADRMGGSTVRTGLPIKCIDWLDPEEHLVVAGGTSVHIWDITSRNLLHNFALEHSLHGAVYSRTHNQLVLVAGSGDKSGVKTVSLPEGKSSAWHWIERRLSWFTFSQTTKELVCGGVTSGLGLFNILNLNWRHLNYPNTIAFASSLPNGTVAVNVAGSTIQLLHLDTEPTPTGYLTHAFTVCALDEGRIVFLDGYDHIVLLEPATMANLLMIPRNTYSPPTDRSSILCASLENRMAVHCFKEGGEEHMQLWRFHSGVPEWTVEVDEPPSVGGISPTGARFVTSHNVDNQIRVCVRDTQKGQLHAQLLVDQPLLTCPFEINFESEDRFYSHHVTYRIPYDLNLQQGASHPILCRGQQLFIKESLGRQYDVDDSLGWVVSGSKRVCWIPPGLIKPGRAGYCWAGHSLFMAGLDGTLTKLAFRELS